MFSKILSATVDGIEALPVSVEADVSEGLPLFQMVGFLSSEVREAKDRVRTALKNSHYYLPPKHITVNLSPADIRKEGTAFDLPVALSVLTALGVIPPESLESVMVAGELSLDGRINRIRGVLPMVCLAKAQDLKAVIVPRENAREGAIIRGIKVYGAENLSQVIEFLLGICPIDCEEPYDICREESSICEVDFSLINGQRYARRALEVAVAGLHNILLAGPPGAGKTMLAKAIPGIMPALTFEESLELSKIYSVCGKLPENNLLITRRPFRDIHHATTPTALTGGGSGARPGELSLASSGVLFLDELPEFSRTTLEVLRQPLEERRITVTRLSHSYTYPASFMLVAAMNPCPCGYFPNRNRCKCTRDQITRYVGKISRPLLDRFDLCIDVKQIKSSELFGHMENESSEEIRRRITTARELQLERYRGTGMSFNSELSAKDIDEYCFLDAKKQELLRSAFERMGLSARGCHRIVKTARTIADLAGSKDILEDHLKEAICYRSSSLTDESTLSELTRHIPSRNRKGGEKLA